MNDINKDIEDLIVTATERARKTYTKVVLSYDDESSVYDDCGTLVEKRDVHVKIAAEPTS